MISWDLDEDDPDAVGIFDPHLRKSPRLGYRLAQDRNAGREQPSVFGVDVTNLQPDHHRVSGGLIGVPGDFQEATTEEEHNAGIVARAELPIYRQAEDLAIELSASAQVGRPHEDPAGQHLHGSILAAEIRELPS